MSIVEKLEMVGMAGFELATDNLWIMTIIV